MSDITDLLAKPGVKYLIAYDIACPRRWRRVHRLCASRALAIQYSVFLYIGTPSGVESLVAALRTVADPKFDEIRLYRIRQAHGWTWLGRPLFPPGVGLFR